MPFLAACNLLSSLPTLLVLASDATPMVSEIQNWKQSCHFIVEFPEKTHTTQYIKKKYCRVAALSVAEQ